QAASGPPITPSRSVARITPRRRAGLQVQRAQETSCAGGPRCRPCTGTGPACYPERAASSVGGSGETANSPHETYKGGGGRLGCRGCAPCQFCGTDGRQATAAYGKRPKGTTSTRTKLAGG